MALFLSGIFISTIHPLSDSDQFYHLKVGQVIWETASVPKHDIFTYTAPGVRWITHEWLAELIFYWSYRIAGYWGPIYLVSVVAAATMWVLYLLAAGRGANREFSSLLLFVLAYLTFDWWLARPQIFAYVSFALLFYLLERFRAEQRVVYLYAAVITEWFWANVNASFILGLAVIGAYWIVSLLDRRDSSPSQRLLGLTLVGAAAISMVNPNGYAIFLYSFYIQPVVRALNIAEWHSILMHLGDGHTKILVAAMLAGDLFILFWFGLRKASRDALILVVVMGVSVMPVLSHRHYAFWALAAIAPLLVGITGGLHGLLKRANPVMTYTLLVGVGGFVLVSGVYSRPSAPLQQTPLPIFGADFVERIGLMGPRFNLYDEGGYLIWQSWPREKVFIDGRSEIPAGAPLQDFQEIVKVGPRWDLLVDDKYRINYFFIPPSKTLLPLVAKLISKRWTLVYWDDATLVYVKNTPQNEAIVGRYGLYYVSPFRDPSTVAADEVQPVKQNLTRALSVAPYSQVLSAYAARFGVYASRN